MIGSAAADDPAVDGRVIRGLIACEEAKVGEAPG
jgi:hypothetical protein